MADSVTVYVVETGDHFGEDWHLYGVYSSLEEAKAPFGRDLAWHNAGEGCWSNHPNTDRQTVTITPAKVNLARKAPTTFTIQVELNGVLGRPVRATVRDGDNVIVVQRVDLDVKPERDMRVRFDD